MPAININGKEFQYEENQVVEFAEGLIGLPNLRRAAIVESDEFTPFSWLASLDDESLRFLVVDPQEIYTDYSIENAGHTVLTIVKICSDWQKTTVNLRAPIMIDRDAQRGTQVILSDSAYKLEEVLP